MRAILPFLFSRQKRYLKSAWGIAPGIEIAM